MKKIFTLFILTLMVFMGAKADPEIRFFSQIRSFNASNEPGAVATFTIDENFVGTLTLPNAYEQTGKTYPIYSNKIEMEIYLQNIQGLQIKDRRSYTKTITTSKNEPRYYSNILSSLYADPFDPTAEFKKTLVLTQEGSTATFNITRVYGKPGEPDEDYMQIILTPDKKENAQAVWDKLAKNITVENLTTEQSDFFIEAGSTIINDNEKFTFKNGCALANFNNLKSSLQKFKDATTLETIESTGTLSGTLTAGSYWTLGKTKLIINKTLYANGGDATILNFFKTIKQNIDELIKLDDSEIKIQAISKFLSRLEDVNYNILSKDEIKINSDIKPIPTAINRINANNIESQSTEIYTIDGRKVSATQQHGFYIINGKKVVK